MKRFLTLFGLCIIVLQAFSQEMVHGVPMQTIHNIGRQKNGKFSASIVRHAGPKATYIRAGQGPVINGETSSAVNKIKNSNETGNPAQIRHIRFHFDLNYWNNLLLVGTDTIFTGFSNLNWINGNTLEGYIPDGYYEMVSSMEGMTINNYFYLFKHRFHVYRDMDTNLLSSSANHSVKLQAVNESGDTLVGNSLASGDGWGINVEFQDGSANPYTSVCYTGTLPDSLHMTDTPPEMKILTNRIFTTGTSHYHQYMVSYPPITGLTGNLTRCNQPEDLHKIFVAFKPTPGGRDYYFAWGYGPVENDSLTGRVNSFVGAFLFNDYPAAATDTVVYFYNQSACDTNKSFFASFADHLEMNPMASSALSDLFCPISYLYKDSIFVLSTQGNYPPIDGDYRVDEESIVPIGTSAPFNVAWQLNKPLQPEISIYTHFRGQSNERRYVDNSFSTYEIWDLNGRLFRDTLRNFSISYFFPYPKKCRVVLNDSNYVMFGHQGFSQTLLDFDLANASDACSPGLIAFKVMQDSKVSQTVIRGYPSTIKFTAADYDFTASGQRIARIPASARMFIKFYSDTSWTELNVTAVPALSDPTAGTTYVSDPGTSLYQFSDSTLADLKLVLVDSAGNTTTQTMHPAFLVRDVMTGVKPLPMSSCEVKVYPDPATDKITITGSADEMIVSIFTATGKVILRDVKKREIDIRGLSPGLYILQIHNLRNGKIERMKFIKR